MHKHLPERQKSDLIAPDYDATSEIAPIIVPKKDGSVRITFNLQPLNARFKPYTYHGPGTRDAIAHVSRKPYLFLFTVDGWKYFDRMRCSSRLSTLLILRVPGLPPYRLLSVPQGAKTASQHAQRLSDLICCRIQEALTDTDLIVEVDLSAIIDDFLGAIHFKDSHAHLQEKFEAYDKQTVELALQQSSSVLKIVFKVMKEFNVYLSLKKPILLVRHLASFGFSISPNGYSPSTDHLRVIDDIELPTSIPAVRSFAGGIAQYQQFIPDYDAVARPLLLMLAKDTQGISFDHPDFKKSFEALKEALKSQPILRPPDTTKPFYIFVDTSKAGCGFTLSQADGSIFFPIEYGKYRLTKTESNYSR